MPFKVYEMQNERMLFLFMHSTLFTFLIPLCQVCRINGRQGCAQRHNRPNSPRQSGGHIMIALWLVKGLVCQIVYTDRKWEVEQKKQQPQKEMSWQEMVWGFSICDAHLHLDSILLLLFFPDQPPMSHRLSLVWPFNKSRHPLSLIAIPFSRPYSPLTYHTDPGEFNPLSCSEGNYCCTAMESN